jgi:hypothetical protein
MFSTNLFLVGVGLEMGNTVIPSYVIDCYPLQSMSVMVFYSVMLDFSAFIDPVCRPLNTIVAVANTLIVLHFLMGRFEWLYSCLCATRSNNLLHRSTSNWTHPLLWEEDESEIWPAVMGQSRV